MAERPGCGRAVAALKCNADGSFELDIKALTALLLADHVRNLPVAVISVGGGFRKGKSFLINFFIRYLRNQSRSDCLSDGDSTLDGFAWRGGASPETKGILLWSEIFVVTTAAGEDVAVVLMDTQGTFDGKSTIKGAATIFSLSMLLSSVQIYNLFHTIGEDDLQHLQLFSDYGQLAQKDGHNTPFQKLLFLVRDWSFPYDFIYGEEGGRAFIQEQLQASDEQPTELRNLRQRIKSCFEEITCFLMPHPGLKVATDPEFKGSLLDIEPNFKDHLDKLLVALLHPMNLQPKKINGCIITCEKLNMYFQAYENCFKNGIIPDPMSMREATGKANNASAVTDALQYYMSKMKEVCENSAEFVPDNCRKSHEEKRGEALQKFDNASKLGGKEMELVYRTKVIQVLDVTYMEIFRTMNYRGNFESNIPEIFKSSFLTAGTALLSLPFFPASLLDKIALLETRFAGAGLTAA